MEKFNKNTAKVKIVLFCAVILAFCIIGLAFFARPTVSEAEKRELTKFPKFTVESFLSGDYTSQISLWFADTYPLRESMIAANSSLSQLYGIKDEQIVGGGTADDIPTGPADIEFNPTDDGGGTGIEGLYLNGNTAYQLYFFSQQNSNSYVSLINKFADQVKGKAQVYNMIVPLHCEIAMSEQTLKKYNASSCDAAIQYMYSNLSDSVIAVDVTPTLKAHNGEYLYYRTDHHWTALGAYYAYVTFCEQKGITPTPLASYNRLQFDGFLGTFYENEGLNRPAAMKADPDFVEAFVPIGTNVAILYDKNGNVEDADYRVVFPKVSNANKYLCFIGGDHPLIEIDNPQINDGSSIVVVKESYGNAFVPFLVDSYDHVYVVDYRYWNGNLSDFVEQKGIDDVLFLNVVNNTSTPERLNELVLADYVANIDGGVIIRYGDMEINCSLDMIFSRLRESLESEVNKILFNQN